MKRGFTIVEILVVIVLIALLAGITYAGVRDWRGRAVKSEVKSDLQNAANALDSTRNFNNGYPASLSTAGFRSSDNVTLTYGLRSDGSYCLNGSSTTRTTVKYNIDSRVSKTPVENTCTP